MLKKEAARSEERVWWTMWEFNLWQMGKSQFCKNWQDTQSIKIRVSSYWYMEIIFSSISCRLTILCHIHYNSTRKVWVYFLKKKSKVIDTFRKWKVMVEKETSLKVKRLRSNSRGEYRDSKFREFYANNKIKMEKTVPMTPQ